MKTSIKIIVTGLILISTLSIHAQKKMETLSLDNLKYANDSTISCFFQILPSYEYLQLTEKYLAPNPAYPRDSIDKYYVSKVEKRLSGSGYFLRKIHPAEYVIRYDTIIIKNTDHLKKIELIESDTISIFFEILPADTLLMQCSKCNRWQNNLFNAFCENVKPPIRVLHKKYIKSTQEIIFIDTFPQPIITERYEMIQLPLAEYIYKKSRTLWSDLVATPKMANAPEHLVITKSHYTYKPMKSYACFTGFTWRSFTCETCHFEPSIYNNGKIIALQHKLQTLGYLVKLTNLADPNLIQILKDMDLSALKNVELIKCAQELIH